MPTIHSELTEPGPGSEVFAAVQYAKDALDKGASPADVEPMVRAAKAELERGPTNAKVRRAVRRLDAALQDPADAPRQLHKALEELRRAGVVGHTAIDDAG